jgi:Transposase DDE domain
MFPQLPGQSGYNKRLRKLAPVIAWLTGVLGADTSIGGDDVWVVDSTPVECARSTETVKRSELAGWAQYGYCASHSRYFWGLRLHLLCTLHGLPLGWAITGAKADEREVLIDILFTTPVFTSPIRPKVTIIGDKNYYGRDFETTLAECGVTLLRPARKGEAPRGGQRFFKPLRQVIESVNDTLKGQLDLEHHGGRTIAGVATRIAGRILALTAAIWHNDHLGHTIRRSLTAYDH